MPSDFAHVSIHSVVGRPRGRGGEKGGTDGCVPSSPSQCEGALCKQINKQGEHTPMTHRTPHIDISLFCLLGKKRPCVEPTREGCCTLAFARSIAQALGVCTSVGLD